MSTRIIWHGSVNRGAFIWFVWWGKGAWRWPKIERLQRKGHGSSCSRWRYQIGPVDGKLRWGKPNRTQLWMPE